MNGETSIVKTKVLIPGRRPDLLHRSRLVDFIHEHIDHKLILVSASAGYGKTSLLIDFAHDVDLPVCWYSADEWDQDVRVFLEYLVASIAERYPGFGERTQAALQAGTSAEGPASVAGLLVNEIYDFIPDYFALVVDDFHLVADSKEVTNLVSFLLRRLPENCRMILMSRTTTPGLPIVELTARQEMVGLGSAELRFTTAEIQELLQQSYQIEASLEQAEALAEQSEGWITAILLMTHSWKGLLRTVTFARGDNEQIFDYLAKEVLNQQSGDVQDFLKCSSVLRRMNPALCDDLMGTDNSREMLALLEDQNLFISRLAGDGEEWYRYHQLFQGFLQTKLRDDGDRWAALHLKAGRSFEERESWDEAVRHYLDAEAYDRAQRLVEAVAGWAFSSGRWSSLLSWTDSMITAGHGSPWMHYWQSRVLTNYGRLDDAVAALEKAKDGFAERSDGVGMVRALLQEGSIHRLRSEYAEAIAKTDQALSLMGDMQDAGLTAMAHSIVGICHGLQGELELGLTRLREALTLFESLGEDHLYDVANTLHDIGAIYYSVDLERYLHYSRKALAVWRQLGATGPMAMTLNNIGAAEYRQGRFDGALLTLGEALSESQAMGLIRPQAYAQATLGDVHRAKGDYGLARETYEQAMGLAEEADEGYLIGYVLDAMGNLERVLENLETAEQLIDQAIEKAYEHGSDPEVAVGQISRGILLFAEGKDQEALRTLEQAVSSLRGGGARQELAKAYLHLACVLFHRQAVGEALLNLEMALDTMAQTGFDPLLVDEGTGSRPLLEHALGEAAMSGHRDLLVQLLALTEPAGDHTFVVPSEPVAERLEIIAFGASTVRRDDQVVEAQDLRLRAKEMLFFLLAHPVATKDQIVAALWPELSLAKANSTFHFYLYQVRRLLGGTASVSYEGGAYRLESRHFQYDVDEFHRNLAKAHRAATAPRQTYLLEAISLYKGDYLEDIYSDWTEELRASLQRECHHALEDLARCYKEQERLDDAAETCRKLLGKDPLREDIHRLLIGIMLEVGDRAGATRQFKKLRMLLKDELGAEPSFETWGLLQGLLGDDE